MELLPDVEVELPLAARLAIFTWGGCTLQIRGQVQQVRMGQQQHQEEQQQQQP